MLNLTKQAIEDFNTHVLAEYPKEACGVLVNDEYFRIVNTHPEPTSHFKFNSIDYFQARQKGKIQAILHSHPYDPLLKRQYPAYFPSGDDMTNWMKGTIPWGIAATEGENVSHIVWLNEDYTAPLLGREFVHGIHDCYSLCRDYYKIHHNIIIPNYVRDMAWWRKGVDLYTENFANAGFHEVNFNDARPGDALLIQHGARVINHAAIYLGENKILDHILNRLSVETTYSSMAPYIKKIVRHKDLV